MLRAGENYTRTAFRGTALVGIVYFGESASPLRLILLGVIVMVVIGLRFASPAAAAHGR